MLKKTATITTKLFSIIPFLFNRKAISTYCAILLALLFSYAAYNKLIIYKIFVRQLSLSPVTKGFENILAWFVPGLEILLSFFLLLPRTRLLGLWSSFFLMLIFTVYAYVVPHFFEQHTCSCGGIISSFSWREHFWFNVTFTIIAAMGVSFYPVKSNKSMR